MADALQMLAFFSLNSTWQLIELRLPLRSCPLPMPYSYWLTPRRIFKAGQMAEFLFSDQQSSSSSIDLPTYSTSWCRSHSLSSLYPNPKPRIYACSILTVALLSSLPLSTNALHLHPDSLYSIPSVWPGLLALWLPTGRPNMGPTLQFGLIY